jgi:hypothetical protein
MTSLTVAAVRGSSQYRIPEILCNLRKPILWDFSKFLTYLMPRQKSGLGIFEGAAANDLC